MFCPILKNAVFQNVFLLFVSKLYFIKLSLFQKGKLFFVLKLVFQLTKKNEHKIKTLDTKKQFNTKQNNNNEQITKKKFDHFKVLTLTNKNN